jgi:hypothetical protein
MKYHVFVAALNATWLICSPFDDGVGPFIDTQLLLWGIREVEYARSAPDSPHATHVPFPYATDLPTVPNNTPVEIGIQLPAMGGFSTE